MGQAQRKRQESTRQGRRRNIEIIGQRGNAESTRRKGRSDKGDASINEVELWEIDRSDTSRMMRLAGTEPVRSRAARTKDRGSRSPRPAQIRRRRRARRRKVYLYRMLALLVIAVCLVLIYQTTGAIYRMTHREKVAKNRGIVDVISERIKEKEIAPPEIQEDFLEINDYSRPGTKLKKVKSVFVHYTANPETSAAQNRSYFANLPLTKEREASAHFIIGYEGEILQCIPLDEQAYGVKTRNGDSISIECCYLDEDGKFTQETYDTLIHTLAWLTQKYDLSTEDILRHYDCGGKMCPLYYVEHEDAWEKLLSDVEHYKMPAAL